MKYYFDASALVKRFKPERGQRTVRGLMIEAAQGLHEVVSLDWSRAEFCVAMRKGGILMNRAVSYLKLLGRIVHFEPVTPPVIDDSLTVIYRLRLHAADAAHLAACIRLDCEVLASDDEDLSSKAAMEHLGRQGIQLLDLRRSP